MNFKIIENFRLFSVLAAAFILSPSNNSIARADAELDAASACQKIYCKCDVRWNESGTVTKGGAGRVGSSDGNCFDQFFGDSAGNGDGTIINCTAIKLKEFKKLFPNHDLNMDARAHSSEECSE